MDREELVIDRYHKGAFWSLWNVSHFICMFNECRILQIIEEIYAQVCGNLPNLASVFILLFEGVTMASVVIWMLQTNMMSLLTLPGLTLPFLTLFAKNVPREGIAILSKSAWVHYTCSPWSWCSQIATDFLWCRY